MSYAVAASALILLRGAFILFAIFGGLLVVNVATYAWALRRTRR